MSRILFVVFVVLGISAIFITGCFAPVRHDFVAKVDNYVISQEEFNDAYKNSSYSSSTRILSQHDFLNNMINQKLILLDAQAHGLDKNKEFLKMVEVFWQQSLLTLAVKEKNKEGVNLDEWVANLRKNSKVEISKEYSK